MYLQDYIYHHAICENEKKPMFIIERLSFKFFKKYFTREVHLIAVIVTCYARLSY